MNKLSRLLKDPQFWIFLVGGTIFILFLLYVGQQGTLALNWIIERGKDLVYGCHSIPMTAIPSFLIGITIGIFVITIIYKVYKYLTSATESTEPTETAVPPEKDDKKKDKKDKGTKSSYPAWIFWILKIVAVVVIGYLIFVVITEKLPAIAKSVNDFTDPKNYPTRQNSDNNSVNNKDKELGIYAPVDPENIQQSTSTADPRPGEIWILTWDRCDIEEKNDIASDTKRFVKRYKITAWSNKYLKFEREYLSKEGKKEKIIFEWDKLKNPKYGLWQDAGRNKGPFELFKAVSGGYSGWLGEQKSLYRVPVWFRKQQ